MQAAATNYLNSGVNISTPNGVVGRFTPAYFDVTRVHGCPAGGFTYGGVAAPAVAGQPFSVTATARNALGAPTLNYHSANGFAKDTTISNAGDATGFASNVIAGASGFANGVGTINTINYRFAAKETAPITLTLRGVDTPDGVSSMGHTEETTPARSGRLYIQNAFGSELLALPMPLHAQYYLDSNAGFVTNTADSCTAINTPLIDLINNVENPIQGIAAIKVKLGPPDPTTTAGIANAPVSAGDAGLSFSAPTPTGEGYVDVSFNLSGMPWLQYDWDGDGAHNNNPVGRATFGIYKGSPRQIYLRERY